MSLSPGVRPPFMVLSPNDQGPGISVATFIVISITVIVVLVRLITMLGLKRRPAIEDIGIWIATLLGLVQSIMVQRSIDYGLGRRRDTISARNFDMYSKFHYASEILLITVLALSKISVSLLIHKLAPQKEIKMANLYVMGAIGLWTILSIFGLAFQCKFPHPWIYAQDRCSSQGAIYYPIGVFNILTDLALVVTPIFVLWNVQLPLATRSLVMGSFISRGCVVVVAITQLAFLPTYLHSQDPTWTIANPTLCAEVMMSLSIITACTPTLHHILTNLSTGLAGTHIPSQLALSASQKYGYGSHLGSHPSHMLSSKGSASYPNNYASNSKNGSRNGNRSRSNSRHAHSKAKNNPLSVHPYPHTRSIDHSTTIANVSTSNYSASGSGSGSRKQQKRERARSRDKLGSSDSTKRLTIKKRTVVKTTDITVDIDEEGHEGGFQGRVFV